MDAIKRIQKIETLLEAIPEDSLTPAQNWLLVNAKLLMTKLILSLIHDENKRITSRIKPGDANV
jgi:hypothetical protein